MRCLIGATSKRYWSRVDIKPDLGEVEHQEYLMKVGTQQTVKLDLSTMKIECIRPTVNAKTWNHHCIILNWHVNSVTGVHSGIDNCGYHAIKSAISHVSHKFLIGAFENWPCRLNVSCLSITSVGPRVMSVWISGRQGIKKQIQQEDQFRDPSFARSTLTPKSSSSLPYLEEGQLHPLHVPRGRPHLASH